MGFSGLFDFVCLLCGLVGWMLCDYDPRLGRFGGWLLLCGYAVAGLLWFAVLVGVLLW